MARREYFTRFQCSHEGCAEFAHWRSDTRADQERIHADYGNGKYKCTRHSQPDMVLSPQNTRREYEVTSRQEPHGRYFGMWGFMSGPGFKVFANDFPTGTILRVTAEVVVPNEAGTLADANQNNPSGEAP